MTKTQIQNRQVQTEDDQQQATEPQPDTLDLAKVALDAALDKKALEPVLLQVDELCSYTEYILLLSGRSDRQVDAIADAVSLKMRQLGKKPLGVEGSRSGQWALLDFGDIVVHVFHHPLRQHYDLESLWIDAPRVDIDVPEDAKVSAEDQY